jgi:hypothetical protein
MATGISLSGNDSLSPSPRGEKFLSPERSRGSFFSHPRPRRGIYPRGEPRGESVPLEVQYLKINLN